MIKYIKNSRWVALLSWAYRHRTVVSLGVYGLLSVFGYALAFWLRFELKWPSGTTELFLRSLPLLIVIRILCNRAFRLSTSRWRFVGTHELSRLAGATFLGTALFMITTRLIGMRAVPQSVVLIEGGLTGYLIAGLWVSYRTLFERMRHRRSSHFGRMKRTVIVGAGEAGNLLAREMLRFPTGYQPVGFVDDDPHKWGTSLHGVEVIGSTQDLAAIAQSVQADEIIIAVPSATPSELRRIVERGVASSLPFKVLPGVLEVLSGDVKLHQVRDVRIEDLLGREPVQLELPELAADLCNRTVLVTGAAGSIGSELTRQIALHEPANLILLDQAETDLFYLELEIRERFPDLEVTAIVGDIVDRNTVERVFRTWRPERVFHAAAYKHVPMMELNAPEAVRNNAVGTWRVAEAAGRYNAGRFVLVSTDKAVNPASMMGASKRLAELVILELQSNYPNSVFTAVRFGNVLASSGSVIPLFKRQILEGKPLTVTHSDATRYFMTIPEAVQLILQASLLPEVKGHIAMLDMGKPVRILDLARNLLRLSGFSSGIDDRVVITGLRPGEKLHEDLVSADEDSRPTAIPKVRVIEAPPGNGAFDIANRIAEWDERTSYDGDELSTSLWRLMTELISGQAVATHGPSLSEASQVSAIPARF